MGTPPVKTLRRSWTKSWLLPRRSCYSSWVYHYLIWGQNWSEGGRCPLCLFSGSLLRLEPSASPEDGSALPLLRPLISLWLTGSWCSSRVSGRKIAEEIIVENFPNMGKEIVNQVQEVQRVPYGINPRRNTPIHILIKLPKIKYKEKI